MSNQKTLLFPLKLELKKWEKGDKAVVYINWDNSISANAIRIEQIKKLLDDHSLVLSQTIDPKNSLKFELTIKKEQYWIRWYPDISLIPEYVSKITPKEKSAYNKYKNILKNNNFPKISSTNQSYSSEIKAWNTFCAEVGPSRALHIIRSKNEQYLSPIDTTKDVESEIRENGINFSKYWPSHIHIHTKNENNEDNLNKLVVVKSGIDEVNKTKLLLSDNEEISRWPFDFFEAVSLGMGTIISDHNKVTRIKNAEWLIITGEVTESHKKDDKRLLKLLESKIANDTIGIFPQDYATKNADENTVHSTIDKDPVHFLKIHNTSKFKTSDTVTLARTLLGQTIPKSFKSMERVGSHDLMRHKLFAQVFLPKQIEYFKMTLMVDDIDYFHKYFGMSDSTNELQEILTPMGVLPGIRIHSAPYSILPIGKVNKDNELFKYLLRCTVKRKHKKNLADIMRETRIPTDFKILVSDENRPVVDITNSTSKSVARAEDITFIQDLNPNNETLLSTLKTYASKNPSLFNIMFYDLIYHSESIEQKTIINLLKILFDEYKCSLDQLKVLVMSYVDIIGKRMDAWFLAESYHQHKKLIDTPTGIGIYGIVEQPGRLIKRNTDQIKYTLGYSREQAIIAYLILNTQTKIENINRLYISAAYKYLDKIRQGSSPDLELGRFFLEKFRLRDGVNQSHISYLIRKFPTSLDGTENSTIGSVEYDNLYLSYLRLKEHNDKGSGPFTNAEIRTESNEIHNSIAGLNDKVTETIAEINNMLSTCATLMHFEQMYQLSIRNMTKAAACMDFLDGKVGPPELEFIQSWRKGGYMVKEVNIITRGKIVEQSKFLDDPLYIISPCLHQLCADLGIKENNDITVFQAGILHGISYSQELSLHYPNERVITDNEKYMSNLLDNYSSKAWTNNIEEQISIRDTKIDIDKTKKEYNARVDLIESFINDINKIVKKITDPLGDNKDTQFDIEESDLRIYNSYCILTKNLDCLITQEDLPENDDQIIRKIMKVTKLVGSHIEDLNDTKFEDKDLEATINRFGQIIKNIFGESTPNIPFIVADSTEESSDKKESTLESNLIENYYQYIYPKLRTLRSLLDSNYKLYRSNSNDSLSMTYEKNASNEGNLVSIWQIEKWRDFIPNEIEEFAAAFKHNEPNQESPNLLILSLSDKTEDEHINHASRVSDTIDLMKIRMISNKEFSNNLLNVFPGYLINE